ncbi:MAG: hypothetical protein ACRD0W_20645 [Acidimicrobiales bacterium]
MVTTTRPAPSEGRQRPPGSPRFNTIVGVVVVLAYLTGLALAMSRVSYDIWGAMVVGPILLVVTMPLLLRTSRREADPWMIKLLIVAFLAKMLGTLIRYAVTFEVYAGHADAGGYHGAGRRLAEAFWAGNWDAVYQAEVPELVGTEFMRLATGLVYIVTGPTKLGGFLVFSWLSFWGLYFFYRAFRVGFPDGDHRRYAVLLFFLPSLLYWPSSIGKEAWMLFTLGIAAYGVALVLRHRGGGYLLLAIGLGGTALVRPHITMLTFVALFVAYLLRRRSWRETQLGLLGRLAGVGVLLLAGGLLLTQAASFFNLDDIDRAAVEQVFERTEDQSARGGSEFASTRPKSPGEYPGAVMTVLFRPFLWETGNAQAAVAAIEGTVLLLLFVMSAHRLAQLPRTMFRVPYVAFAVSYTAMFVFAFSAVSNFGIIARQRTQVLPMILVMLAIPVVARTVADRASPRIPEHPKTVADP